MEELKNEQQASKKKETQKRPQKRQWKNKKKREPIDDGTKKINRTGRTKTSTRTVEIIYGASRKAA